MSNQKISDMPSANLALDGTELIPLVQGGANVQTAIGNAVPILSSGGTTTISPLGADTEIDVIAPSYVEIGAGSGVDAYTTPVTGSDNSGSLSIISGTAVNGDTGDVQIITGASSGGDSGSITLGTGSADGTRGSIILSANTISSGADDGYLQFQTADQPSGTSADIYVFTGAPGDNHNSGALNFGTGNHAATGNTGDAYLYSGNASDGDSGSVFLQSGTASGTRGNIILDGLLVLVLNLPTSAAGLPTGALWNSSGTLKVA